jgi:hypothetical protein
MPSCAKAQIVPNFRIADGFYDAYSRPTIEGCVADCKKMRRMRCTLALVHAGRQKIPPDYRSAGRSARPAATSSPAQAESKLPTGQAWRLAMDKLKLRRHAADSASPPAALQPSALVAELDTAHAYLSSISSEGSGPTLLWRLQFSSPDATTGAKLNYSFVVHGTGGSKGPGFDGTAADHAILPPDHRPS